MALSLTHDEFLERLAKNLKLFRVAIMARNNTFTSEAKILSVSNGIAQFECSPKFREEMQKLVVDTLIQAVEIVYMED